jgi:membrane protease YdiL (CAAX protease family)
MLAGYGWTSRVRGGSSASPRVRSITVNGKQIRTLHLRKVHKMASIVRKYPASSLLFLAMILGGVPVLAAAAGLLPAAAAGFGALSAGIAGVVLAAVESQKGGVRELLARLLIWRVGIMWWAFALLFPIVPCVAAVCLLRFLGGPPADWSVLRPISTVLPNILFLTILAGVGEELGWRGFALPRLQARYNALSSGLIVGAIWAIWHIPLFFLPGTFQYQWRSDMGLIIPVLGYAAFVFTWSIQYVWVFNNTEGSVLLAALVHGAGNAWIGDYISVHGGHFGALLSFTAVSGVVSIAITFLAGPTNLSRSKVRNMLPSEGASAEQRQPSGA